MNITDREATKLLAALAPVFGWKPNTVENRNAVIAAVASISTPQPPPEAGSVGVPELQAMVLLLRTALVKAMNWNWCDSDAQPSATATFCNAALSSVDAMLSAAPAPKESP